MTFVHFRTEGDVDEFIDMCTKFNKKRENKLTVSFEIFVGMSECPMHEILCSCLVFITNFLRHLVI